MSNLVKYQARRDAIETKLETIKRLINEHSKIGPVNGPMIGDLIKVDETLGHLIEFLGDIDANIR